MAISDWLQQKFGDTGGNLLDQDVYSDKELKKDIKKLNHKHKRLEKKMDEHQDNYREILEKGANAPDFKKQALAQKAQLEKKKYNIQRKKYNSSSKKLAALVSIEGAREILDMTDSNDLVIDDVMEDNDDVRQNMQAVISNRMAEFGIDQEVFEEISGELDIPLMDDEISMDGSEEFETMKKLEEGQLKAEEVSLAEEETPAETDESIDEFSDPDLGDI